MGWWTWLNGKKTVIGAVLDLVSSALAGLLAFLPQFGDALAGLGLNGAWLIGVLAIVGKVALFVGIVHKAFKQWFA